MGNSRHPKSRSGSKIQAYSEPIGSQYPDEASNSDDSGYRSNPGSRHDRQQPSRNGSRRLSNKASSQSNGHDPGLTMQVAQYTTGNGFYPGNQAQLAPLTGSTHGFITLVDGSVVPVAPTFNPTFMSPSGNNVLQSAATLPMSNGNLGYSQQMLAQGYRFANGIPPSSIAGPFLQNPSHVPIAHQLLSAANYQGLPNGAFTPTYRVDEEAGDMDKGTDGILQKFGAAQRRRQACKATGYRASDNNYATSIIEADLIHDITVELQKLFEQRFEKFTSDWPLKPKSEAFKVGAIPQEVIVRQPPKESRPQDGKRPLHKSVETALRSMAVVNGYKGKARFGKNKTKPKYEADKHLVETALKVNDLEALKALYTACKQANSWKNVSMKRKDVHVELGRYKIGDAWFHKDVFKE